MEYTEAAERASSSLASTVAHVRSSSASRFRARPVAPGDPQGPSAVRRTAAASQGRRALRAPQIDVRRRTWAS